MTRLIELNSREFSKLVGHRIALARIARGMTQFELALEVGQDRGDISHYECGRRIPLSFMLYKIAKALDVSIDSLCEPL